MQLIGRNLSPFVRRTAIVLNLLDLKYEQVGLSTADDMAEIAKHNPIVRVPAMILDDGEALLDSNAIIDHLLEVADPDNRLLPASAMVELLAPDGVYVPDEVTERLHTAN